MSFCSFSLNQSDVVKCEKFVDRVFQKSPKFVAISGSYASGTANADSDYDIVVLSETIDKFKSEQLHYKGDDFDLMVIPLEKIEDMLASDYGVGDGVFLGMLSKAVIVRDKNDVLKSLIMHYKSLYKNGNQILDYAVLKSLKTRILGRIKDLKDSSQKKEQYLIVTELVRYFTEFVLLKHRFWLGNSKMIYDQIYQLDKGVIHQNINDGLKAFYTNRDLNRLLSFVSNYMSKNAGNDTVSLTEGTLNYTNSDYLIIKIESNETSDVYNTYRDLRKNIEQIKNKLDGTKKYWIFRSNNLIQGTHTHNQIYVIFFSEKKIINQQLPKLLTYLDKISTNKHRYYTPMGIDLSLVFNPCFKDKTMLEIVCNFSSRLIEQNFTPNKALLVALELFYEFSESTSQPNAFSKYIYTSWLSKAYDTGVHGNFKALTLAKKKKIEAYQTLWTKQKAEFNHFFSQRKECGNYFIDKNILKHLNSIGKGNYIQQYHLYGIDSKLPQETKKQWFALKVLLDWMLGVLLVKESDKPYIPYLVTEVIKQKKTSAKPLNYSS